MVRYNSLSPEVQAEMTKYLSCDTQYYNERFSFFFYIEDLGERLQIGNAAMYVENRSFVWTSFYPKQQLYGLHRKDGVGTKAHIMVLEELINRFGDSVNYFKVVHTQQVSSLRRDHLKKMGLLAGEVIFSREVAEPFSEYYQTSLQYFKRKEL